MMLQKGWFKRRALAAEPAPEPESTVSLEFVPVDLEAECEHGRYYIDRVAFDWQVRFRPADALWETRDVHIDAVDADGSACDWPTRGCAEKAAKLHANLLGMGHSVGRATQLVAERSQRVAEQREVTLDYAEARS